MRASCWTLAKIGLRRTDFFLDNLYYVLHKGYYVASTNFGEFSCGPFILSQLNMEKDRRGVRVGLISVRPVDDSGVFFRNNH